MDPSSQCAKDLKESHYWLRKTVHGCRKLPRCGAAIGNGIRGCIEGDNVAARSSEKFLDLFCSGQAAAVIVSHYTDVFQTQAGESEAKKVCLQSLVLVVGYCHQTNRICMLKV